MLLRRRLLVERGHKPCIFHLIPELLVCAGVFISLQNKHSFSNSSLPPESKDPVTLIHLFVARCLIANLNNRRRLQSREQSISPISFLQLEEPKCSGLRNALIAVSSCYPGAVKHPRGERQSSVGLDATP
ncbi:hypothetical protein CEXT_702761 [Caerostris extrusa]|uniref:Uncharacterized protein n=1 Tax=Caerostris extrusa TaxID=172846 RepID=A0AAV4Q5B9_CAEEX|nr:hypothetical protein CEXT_702761 [Caerostris extrusa]